MPKRATVNPKEAAGLHRLTEQERDRGEQQPEGRNLPIGLYVTRAQNQKLTKIASENGVTLHSLLKFALARFLADYDAGKIELKTETKMTQKMSDE
jgi:beta-lactamase class A